MPRAAPSPLSWTSSKTAPDIEDFPDFTQPALIFHGAHDDVVPAGFSREFAASHPNARLEILNSGHELTNVLDYMAPKSPASCSRHRNIRPLGS